MPPTATAAASAAAPTRRARAMLVKDGLSLEGCCLLASASDTEPLMLVTSSDPSPCAFPAGAGTACGSSASELEFGRITPEVVVTLAPSLAEEVGKNEVEMVKERDEEDIGTAVLVLGRLSWSRGLAIDVRLPPRSPSVKFSEALALLIFSAPKFGEASEELRAPSRTICLTSVEALPSRTFCAESCGCNGRINSAFACGKIVDVTKFSAVDSMDANDVVESSTFGTQNQYGVPSHIASSSL
mmetsp:Transcript_48465/g.135397  ORF Transcript_48465/g.135397 Transcript_48465/m.135397 type:complete len:242 (+) Transcript_48465:212-937(+)